MVQVHKSVTDASAVLFAVGKKPGKRLGAINLAITKHRKNDKTDKKERKGGRHK